MSLFRTFVAFITLTMALYTVIALKNDGIDFMTPYFIGLFSLTWQGHINADFSFFLSLSALWIAWRERFSPIALIKAVVIGVLGMVLFAPYLLHALSKSKGDPKTLLLGQQRL
ncbi:hypothetical protein [Planktotalea sp.]|uniref:hypothetical protein n=1 Tax=Planktotalea sp. TaxID=2029877 RepID=UPI003D6C4C3F